MHKISTAKSHTVTQKINTHKQQNRQKYISDGIFSSQDAKLDFEINQTFEGLFRNNVGSTTNDRQRKKL